MATRITNIKVTHIDREYLAAKVAEAANVNIAAMRLAKYYARG